MKESPFVLFAVLLNSVPASEAFGSPERPVAAVLLDQVPGLDPGLARELAAEVEAAGYSIRFIGADLFSSPEGLSASRLDLLVLPGARSLPAQAAGPLEGFLKAGGDLIALGLPAWKSPIARIGDRWMSRADYEKALSERPPQKVLFDFEKEDLARWRRSANDPGSRATHDLAAGDHGKALRVTIDDLTGWDTFSSPPLDGPFPPGHTLTCFRAKGGARTPQLSVEWVERDGSRWIATVDLSTRWKRFALPPEAFLPWQPPRGRGGKGDRLQVEKAARITLGLAHTHTRGEGPKHEYWVDDLGTSPNPFGEAPAPPAAMDVPRLETISPGYLFYPVTGPVKLSTPPDLRFAGEAKPEAGGKVEALHPRPRGVGFAKGRPWRWQPLLTARSPEGDPRGTIASLLVNIADPFRGGLWAAFTPTEAAFYRQEPVKRLIREVATAIRRGVFLEEGGSEFFTVFEDQGVRLGARATNFGRQPAKIEVRLSLSKGVPEEVAESRRFPLDLPPGKDGEVSFEFRPGVWPEGGYRVVAEILEGEKAIDRLSQEVHVWHPREKPSFIESRDGGLWLGGKPWKANGVNYMPSSGIGQWSGRLFEQWLGREAYDPEVIDRDLSRIKGMGLNAVSVFVYHESMKGQNLLDFLRRAEALGLKVNQSLRPGTPMDFRWKEMRELIEHYRLARNDTVFAYDLAWEPSHHDHRHQKGYAPLWEEWIRKRRGGIEGAERAWGVPAPREDGGIGVPPADMLTRDGDWRKMVADYRGFLDDLLGEKYAEARRLVRSIDPNHPVSFRMQHAGDPTINWDQLLPYDFYGLSGAVDIWEPEAYGRIGDWEKVKGGRFTAAYARLCDPAKPIVWAEMGYDVWDKARMEPQPDRLAFAGRYYADFFRMMRESGADGIFFWWYPGGFRVGENSDFGILNPDGTDRSITKVIRKEGPRFLAAPKPPAPSLLIPVDRDRDARGLFGIHEAVKEEYWRAVEAGKSPGLRWARRPGSP